MYDQLIEKKRVKIILFIFRRVPLEKISKYKNYFLLHYSQYIMT